MRKFKRERIRREAERRGIKASGYLHGAWDALQKKLVGSGRRGANVARGTHKRNTWKARINLYAPNKSR